jgi:hypothetical protein
MIISFQQIKPKTNCQRPQTGAKDRGQRQKTFLSIRSEVSTTKERLSAEDEIADNFVIPYLHKTSYNI